MPLKKDKLLSQRKDNSKSSSAASESELDKPLFLGTGGSFGLSIDSVWGRGLAPIHLAALHGRLDCLRLLIEKHKVDVNLVSGTGWRPIHLAISNQTGKRSLQCLVYLLEHGADASVTNEDGVTPVHQAASEGHVQCLKLLIDVKAKIDARDRRGHLPIDLAKLWGHRKCARILATEKWHLDKDFISREMRELKKTKMQAALQELEDFDKEDDEQFYGQTAFNDWLTDHGIQTQGSNTPKPKPPRQRKKEAAKPPEKKPEKISERVENKPAEKRPVVLGGRLQPIKESLYKPNSVSSGQSDIKQQEPHLVPEKRVQVVSHESEEDGTHGHSSRSPSTMASSSPERAFYGDLKMMKEISPHQELLYSTEPQETHEAAWYNEKPWNKSTKVKETFHEYLPLLPDVYPRDNFTMMPHKHATPHELNIWKSPKVFVTNESEQIKRADAEVNIKKKLDEMQISPEAQEVILNPNGVDRPVLFKCQNIIDVPTKKRVSESAIPKTEAALHLSSDLRSELVRRALLVELEKRAPSKISVESFSSNGNREVLPPRERLLKAFSNFTKPTYYPNINGEQFDINLGQVKAV
ncbi:uncharacterized protein LOC135488998 isoform X2 [Lineus longissimus]|uniref:uncharacterized protein LOC135488998 isoform X2 n=1 Tax=Lineus longissimus TaxID=88925 RepID=UPI002B4DB372